MNQQRGPKLKEGIDYFPLDSAGDHRLEYIRGLCDWEGAGVLLKLLQQIHHVKGYYMHWDDRIGKSFARLNGFKPGLVEEVIRECLYADPISDTKESIFDEDKFIKYKILTSVEIQKVWINVAKERKELIHRAEFLLIDISKYIEPQAEEQKKPGNNPPLNSINPPLNSNFPPIISKGNSENPPHIPQGSKQVRKEESEASKEASNEGSKEQKPYAEGVEPSAGSGSVSSDSDFYIEKFSEAENAYSDADNTAVIRDLYNTDQTVENLTSENEQSDTTVNKSGEKSSKKKKDPPHPMRDKLIEDYEYWTQTAVGADKDSNIAIKSLLTKLEKTVRLRNKNAPDEEVYVQMQETWRNIFANWDKLPPWMQKNPEFSFLSARLTSMLTALKDLKIESEPVQGKNTEQSIEDYRRKYALNNQ